MKTFVKMVNLNQSLLGLLFSSHTSLGWAHQHRTFGGNWSSFFRLDDVLRITQPTRDVTDPGLYFESIRFVVILSHNHSWFSLAKLKMQRSV